jgi:phage protein D
VTADLSAPTFRVAVRGAGSSEIVDVPNRRIISLTFEDEETKADKLTLQIDNHDLSQLDNPAWQAGNTIIFQFGYPGAMSPVREAKIQGTKGFNPLTVEAHGAESSMNRAPRTDRHWENTKRSDVVREILRGYGFSDLQMFIEDTKLVLDQITQGRLTDLQLLRSIAQREGFEFYVDFDGVHFHPRKLDQPPIRTWVYFTDPGRGDIINIAVEDSKKAGKPGSIVAQGRDPITKESFEVKVDGSTTTMVALAPERTVVGPEDKPSGTWAEEPSTEVTEDFSAPT